MGIWEDLFDKAKSVFNEEGHQPKRRCYYELLEVERDASEDEIKKAYKKQALKWHPDKNPDRLEECNAYFVVLQQAYDVLSDPRERAFYDKHRENIIQGGGTEETKDEGINLYPFFQTCYRGFGDDKESFYSIYRELFDKLAAEEYPYIDDDDDKNYPSFGKSDSDYERIVGPFYSFWANFSTQRSFAWLDKWNLRDAPNRQTARAMEKDNKKLREVGKRQRNEEIRQLVMYVRKRDKRVKQYRELVEDRRKEQLQRVEEHRRQRLKENLDNLEKYEVDDEKHQEHLQDLEEIENALDAQFGTVDVNSDASDEENDFYCIVCEKAFKNDKSLSNHQKSKKHKQAVEELRKVMKEEDARLVLGSDKEEEVASELPQPGGKSKKKRRKARRKSSSSSENDNETKENMAEETAEVAEVTTVVEDVAAEESKSKKQSNASKSSTAPPKPSGPTVAVASECKVCGAEFESRSKLFKHIQDTGHAALKNVPDAPATKKGGKKTGKSKK